MAVPYKLSSIPNLFQVLFGCNAVASLTIKRAVKHLTLRDELEQRTGKLEDRFYSHILEMALDDIRQYKILSQDELHSILYPANNSLDKTQHELLEQMKERMLEAMEILSDIVRRHKIDI